MNSGWVYGWWTRHGSQKKDFFFGSLFHKIYSIFFLVVPLPLRRGLKTFSVQNSKKMALLIFDTQFQAISVFRDFVRSVIGDLVYLLEVCTTGVLEGISTMTEGYPKFSGLFF